MNEIVFIETVSYANSISVHVTHTACVLELQCCGIKTTFWPSEMGNNESDVMLCVSENAPGSWVSVGIPPP